MFFKKNKDAPFTENEKLAIWSKAQKILWENPSMVRMDACGAVIHYSEYGNTHSKYGWEIDHIIPKATNGSREPANLQVLQWENNRHKGDNWPQWAYKAKK